ncbi:hypothetical protein B566_EDAN013991 [Ephemera danica]|nr:hypothetical protein B566_EDAN013991 [Ephemera danica]
MAENGLATTECCVVWGDSQTSHSGAQQTKTASELGNLFNCNVSDCEFVLCQSQEQKSHLASPETDKQLNITNEIIETKNHFSAPKCVALSEKSDLLQKLKENFGLKSVSEETTSSTGNPSALHVAEETELHEATEQNQVEEMKELIDRDLTLLNTRDRDGKSSLHVACEMDNTEAAECLLCYPDCLVDIADKYGKYALHYAAENGNVDIIKLLLKREAFSMPG